MRRRSRTAGAFLVLGAAFRQISSDPVAVVGLTLGAIALFALGAASADVPVSRAVAPLLQAYRPITALFDLPERLLRVGISNPVRDALVFWAVMGMVGGRTMLRFSRRMYEIAGETLQKWEDREARRRAEESRGAAWVEGEIARVTAARDFHQSSLENRMSLYLGCAATGPLFFLHILRVNPRMPAHGPVTGRHMVFVQFALLLLACSGLFVLNGLAR